MQIQQRMEVDQNEDLSTFKATNNEKITGNNNKRRNRNRAFGQDITNKARQSSNQLNIAGGGGGKGGKLAANNKSDGFNFNKQQPVKLQVIKSKSESVSAAATTTSINGNNNNNNKGRQYRSQSLHIELTDFKQEKGENNNENNENIENNENNENNENGQIVRKLDMNKIEEEGIKDEDGDDLMKDFEEIQSPSIHPWDCRDVNSDIAVTDYVNEIIESLKNDELSSNGYVVEQGSDFMASQNDVNSRMRVVLIDWLIEVHRKFKLLPTTYFLAINLLDRYLEKKQLNRSKLQLAGCTCLWISSKYHEIYAPEMDDFVYISDNAFCDQDLMTMEIEILSTLQFNLTVPTVLSFIQRYIKISSYYLKKEREVKIISDLMIYITEHCVMSYEICRNLPSKIAAAAFVYSCISTKVFSTETFKNDNIDKVIGYDINELSEIMKKIDETVRNAKKSKHKAVYKKYSSPTYSNIAKLNFNKLNTNFIAINEEKS